MIRYEESDLLTVESGVIVHGCNAQGVMGSGVAKALRDKYPSIYEPYRALCNDVGLCKEHILGRYVSVRVLSPLLVVNAITQLHYGRDGIKYVSYDAVHDAFKRLSRYHDTMHIPKIGAGLGGGDWNIIERIINDVAPDVDIICHVI